MAQFLESKLSALALAILPPPSQLFCLQVTSFQRTNPDDSTSANFQKSFSLNASKKKYFSKPCTIPTVGLWCGQETPPDLDTVASPDHAFKGSRQSSISHLFGYLFTATIVLYSKSTYLRLQSPMLHCSFLHCCVLLRYMKINHQ